MQTTKITTTLLLIILTISITKSYCQTFKQTVFGKVINAVTKKPLSGAEIVVLNTSPLLGAITNKIGEFKLDNVPVGNQTLICNYVGFEDAYIIVSVTKDNFKTIEFKLTEALNELEEVVIPIAKVKIKPNNTLATVSARSLAIEETKRFPAAISDPGRMVLSFAGVTNSDDTTNEIVIRGNAPNQMLWRIEGVEVPAPNHFSEEGYSSGAISLLSSNILGKSDFFTGAFPAEYGNANSGVFDIKLKNGNSFRKKASFQLGVLGTDALIEGPYSKKHEGAYLVNYRYSTLTLLNNFVEVSDRSVPTYQDISFKTSLPLHKKTKLSIWGIGGISKDNQDNAKQLNLDVHEERVFKSKTYISGINVKHEFNPKTNLEGIVSYSGSSSSFNYSLHQKKDDNLYTEKNAITNKAARLSLNFNQQLNNKTTLKVGSTISRLYYDVITQGADSDKEVTLVDTEGYSTFFQIYTQAKYKLNNKLTTTFGYHGSYFSVNKDAVLEPRLGMQFKIDSKKTLSVGIGSHSRRMPLNQYFVAINNPLGQKTTPNKEISLMRWFHYVVGYDWKLFKDGHLKVEAYYQNSNNIAVSANLNFTDSVVNGQFINTELVDSGKAKNYGLELTLEKSFSKQYYFLVTNSIFNSKYRALDGNWYNSRYNFNYTFNIVGGKEFSVGKLGQNSIGGNIKTLWNGGKRETPINMQATSFKDEVVFVENKRNTLQFKDYFRLDASIYYKLNRSKFKHIISLDVQNTTNRQNIAGTNFNRNTKTLETNYQLNLLPLLNYRLEF